MDRCTQQIVFAAFRKMPWVCFKSIACITLCSFKNVSLGAAKKIRGCRDLIKPGSYICIWITNGYFTVESLKRPLGLHVIIVSESKFKSSAFSVRLFSLTRFVTCNAIIQFDAVFNTQPLAQWIWKKTCCPQAEGNKESDFTLFFTSEWPHFSDRPQKVLKNIIICPSSHAQSVAL